MIAIGDVHGKIDTLAKKLYTFDNEIFIQVGDFGIGFLEDYYIRRLDDSLVPNNNKLYIIRGNHDDPSYFKHPPKYKQIELLKDYSVITDKDGREILCIGGGVSIDRTHRTKDISWWEDESMFYKKTKKKFDILITHVPQKTIFKSLLIPGLFDYYFKIDKNLLEDTNKEEEILKKIEKDINFKLTISGHLHFSKTIVQNDKTYKVLEELEFFKF